MRKRLIILFAILVVTVSAIGAFALQTKPQDNKAMTTQQAPQAITGAQTPDVSQTEPTTSPSAFKTPTSEPAPEPHAKKVVDLRAEIRGIYLNANSKAAFTPVVEEQAWQCFNDTVDYLMKVQAVKGISKFSGWDSPDQMRQMANISSHMLNPCLGITYSGGVAIFGQKAALYQQSSLEFGI